MTQLPAFTRRVIIESPYAGDIAANVEYARACVRDAIERGDAPLASHLLFTQPGILDDTNAEERAAGMAAGFAWTPLADAVCVYTDRGISHGMEAGILTARNAKISVEFRSLSGTVSTERPK